VTGDSDVVGHAAAEVLARAVSRALAVPFALAGVVALWLAVTPGERQLIFAGLAAFAFAAGAVLRLASPDDLRLGHAVMALATLAIGVGVWADGASQAPGIVLAAWGAPIIFAIGTRRAIVGHVAWVAVVAAVVLVLPDQTPSHPGPSGDVARWLAWVLAVPAIGVPAHVLAATLRAEAVGRRQAAQIARLAHWRFRPAEDRVVWEDLPAALPLPRTRAETLAWIHPDDRPAFEAALARAEGPEARPFELEVRRLAGGEGVRHVLVRAEGRRDGEVAGTSQDVTALRSAQGAAAAAQGRFEQLVEAAPDALVAADAQGRVELVNAATERLVGLPRTAMVGRRIFELPAIAGDDEARRLWDAFFAGGADPGRERRLTIQGADGPRTVDVTGSRIELAGRPHVLIAVRDMTDAERAARTTAELERRLADAERLESVGRLAGGVAHDFNNLLTVIVASADHVAAGLGPDHALAGDVDEVRAAARSAAELTRQLLVFSRRDTPHQEIVDVAVLVRRTAELLRRTLGDDIALSVAADEPGCTVTGDPSQLEQVVMNLALNARDALPRGGRITITVARTAGITAAGGRADRVALTVADTGEGMTGEVLQHAFEPFFTTKHRRRGTGLGLVTVQGVVERLGGSVTLRSEPGEGTVAEVLVPRTAAATGATRPAPPPAALPEAAGGAGERVLVVEDQAAVRRSLVRILERAGYTVLQAEDGEHALAVARTAGPVDLVVCDVVMPGMSGPATIAELRAEHGELPALLTSGSIAEALAQAGEVESSAPSVAGAVLQKPFTADSVLRAVREALETGAVRGRT
jgi:PAS domain S-box-containing protein